MPPCIKSSKPAAIAPVNKRSNTCTGSKPKNVTFGTCIDSSARSRHGSSDFGPLPFDYEDEEDAETKNPAIAVCNSSFELLRNKWDPLDCFRLPVKACRPQPQLRPLDLFTTVQGHSF